MNERAGTFLGEALLPSLAHFNHHLLTAEHRGKTHTHTYYIQTYTHNAHTHIHMYTKRIHTQHTCTQIHT